MTTAASAHDGAQTIRTTTDPSNKRFRHEQGRGPCAAPVGARSRQSASPEGRPLLGAFKSRLGRGRSCAPQFVSPSATNSENRRFMMLALYGHLLVFNPVYLCGEPEKSIIITKASSPYVFPLSDGAAQPLEYADVDQAESCSGRRSDGPAAKRLRCRKQRESLR